MAELIFDGAMADPYVYVNGEEAGHWAYGYNAFRVDVTRFLKAGKLDIGVHLNNREESSRWYPGAGLYRPVTLLLTPKTHIEDWSLFVRMVGTDSKGVTTVEVDGRVVNVEPGMMAAVSMYAPDGKAAGGQDIPINKDGSFHQTFKWKNAMLWSPETP
jgi:beta-galactosidase